VLLHRGNAGRIALHVALHLPMDTDGHQVHGILERVVLNVKNQIWCRESLYTLSPQTVSFKTLPYKFSGISTHLQSDAE
jgi:hypothetical protein